MSSMKLIWECDGQLTPYSVYKSETIFDKDSLPEPYKTDKNALISYNITPVLREDLE